MADKLDYKDAYLTMMRASEQAIRNLELMQQGTAKIMLDLIRAQQKAEEAIIGQDIPLDHFWYFNDFGEYSGDMEDGSTNGVTPENRQWIRDRMANVTFVTQ